MEQNSNKLYHDNMEKKKELKEIIAKYNELGNEMKSLTSKSFELEKKNNIIEVDTY